MLIFLTITIFILGMAMPKSKVITALLTAIQIVIVAYRYNCPDLISYYTEYGYVTSGVEYNVAYGGYFIFQRLALSLNLNFQEYLFFAAFVSTLFTVYGILKLSKHYNIVLSLYLLFPLAYEAIQMKSYLADSFIMVGLPFLIKAYTEKKYSYAIPYFCFTLIGAAMHYMAYFFILIGVVFLFMGKKGISNAKSSQYVCVLVCVATLLSYTNILPSLAKFVFDSDRVDGWFNSRVKMGFVLPLTVVIGIWFLSDYAFKKCGLHIKENQHKKDCMALGSFLRLVLLTIPLFAFNITFDRLLRVFSIILYILIAEIINIKFKEKTEKVIFISLFVCWFGYVVFVESDSAELLINLLSYNSLFD